MNRRSLTLLVVLVAVFLAMPGTVPHASAQGDGEQTPPDLNPHGVFDSGGTACTTCHKPHEQDSSAEQVCGDCHTDPLTHQERPCSACHEPHAQTANAALIRPEIQGSPLDFDGGNYADSPADLCVTCHTQTLYHGAEAEEDHFEGQDCTLCHPHGSGFAPDPQGCDLCHGAPPASGAHSRHQAADIGLDTCSTCHIEVEQWTDPGHRDGTIDFADGATLDNTDTCDACHGSASGIAAAKMAWADGGPIDDCLSCHSRSGPATLAGRSAPAVDAHWRGSGHGRDDEIACQTCHDPQSPHFGSIKNARLRREPATLCAGCHSVGIRASTLFDYHGYFLITQPGFFDNCDSCHQRLGLTVKREHFSDEQGDCTLCHSAHGSSQPASLRQSQPQICGECHGDQVDPAATFAAHAEAEDLMCSTCHDPHLPQAQPAQIERDGCQSCHADLPEPGDLAHPHQPFAAGQCAACHPGFHTAPDAPLLVESQAETCNACHDEHGQRVEQPHPAAHADQCLTCHSGHGSDQPQLLRQAQTDLCAACHAGQADPDQTFAAHTVEQLPACAACHEPHEPATTGVNVAEACAECHADSFTASASVHSPAAEGECVACHSQFHGTESMQLAAVEADVCGQCHEPETGRVQHQPVEAGECESCHNPHSSDHPALLQNAVRPLCGQCHSRQVANFGSSAHKVLGNQCSACHQPHSSNIDALLFSRTNLLCDTCHANLPHGFHPVSGGGLSCTSCHLPHGSTLKADLIADGDALCLTCHSFQSP